MLVEGMGGTMTPILKNYYITDLIKDMKIPTIIVTRSRVGTVNHTIMTVKMCQKYKISHQSFSLVISSKDDSKCDRKHFDSSFDDITSES